MFDEEYYVFVEQTLKISSKCQVSFVLMSGGGKRLDNPEGCSCPFVKLCVVDFIEFLEWSVVVDYKSCHLDHMHILDAHFTVAK